MKEKTLSDLRLYPKEIMPNYQIPLYREEDLKQAIKRLKEEIAFNRHTTGWIDINNKIDKIFGNKLTGSK